MTSLLHCTSEGGDLAAAQPPTVNQGQNPADDLGTKCQGLAVSSRRQARVLEVVCTCPSHLNLPQLTAALSGLEQREGFCVIFSCK